MTTPITQLLDELEAKARAATTGPWCLHANGTSVWEGGDWDQANTIDSDASIIANAFGADPKAVDNMEYIAAMHPSRALELLAVVRAAIQLRTAIYDRDTADGTEQSVVDAFNGLGDALEKLGGSR